MGEDWLGIKIDKKLDDLKEDTHEIKQQIARIEERDKYRAKEHLELKGYVENLEVRVDVLEEQSFRIQGSWGTVLAIAGLLAFALQYFKEVWFK